LPDLAANYASKSFEMSARCAPHTSPTYPPGNNTRGWSIIRGVIYDTDACAWIKTFARAQDGRAAILALQTHYLGLPKLDNILTAAEAAMDTTFYTGEKHRFDLLSKIMSLCTKRLTMIFKVSQGMRKLLAGTNMTKLDAAINTIRTRDDLRSDFDKSVDLLKTFIIRRQVRCQL
jgi:hypothetical protein